MSTLQSSGALPSFESFLGSRNASEAQAHDLTPETAQVMADALQKAIGPLFPDNKFAAYYTRIIGHLVRIDFTKGKTSADYQSGIAMNDPSYTSLLIWGDPKGYRMEVSQFPYRLKKDGVKPPVAKSGTMEQVLKHLVAYFTKNQKSLAAGAVMESCSDEAAEAEADSILESMVSEGFMINGGGVSNTPYVSSHVPTPAVAKYKPGTEYSGWDMNKYEQDAKACHAELDERLKRIDQLPGVAKKLEAGLAKLGMCGEIVVSSDHAKTKPVNLDPCLNLYLYKKTSEIPDSAKLLKELEALYRKEVPWTILKLRASLGGSSTMGDGEQWTSFSLFGR